MRQPALFPAKGFPSALSKAFADFWEAYPPRDPNPRAPAALAFAKAVKQGATPEQLIAAAAGYARKVKAKGIAEDFIVHARTFLSQQRFLDYPVEAEAAAPAEPEHELWPQLVGHMEAADFRPWVGRCRVVSYGDATLVLGAPSTFIAARIRQDYVPLLQRALDRTVTVVVEPSR